MMLPIGRLGAVYQVIKYIRILTRKATPMILAVIFHLNSKHRNKKYGHCIILQQPHFLFYEIPKMASNFGI
jgi:hypothetical protein